MSVIRTRREALKRGLAVASLLSASLSGAPRVAFARAAARAAPTTLRLQPLTDRLSVVSGGACNILVLRSEEGLLLVDGGAAGDVRALLGLLAEK